MFKNQQIMTVYIVALSVFAGGELIHLKAFQPPEDIMVYGTVTPFLKDTLRFNDSGKIRFILDEGDMVKGSIFKIDGSISEYGTLVAQQFTELDEYNYKEASIYATSDGMVSKIFQKPSYWYDSFIDCIEITMMNPIKVEVKIIGKFDNYRAVIGKNLTENTKILSYPLDQKHLNKILHENISVN